MRELETGADVDKLTWIEANRIHTMTGQGVKGTQRLNTQTLMTRQGTGEVDQQVR